MDPRGHHSHPSSKWDNFVILLKMLRDLQKLTDDGPKAGIRPPGRKRQIQNRLTQGVVDAIVSDYEDGLSVNDVADKYDIHRTTVMNHLKRRKVKTRRSVRKLTDRQVKEAISAHKLGEPIAVLAEGLGVDPETLRRAVRKVSR